MGKRAQEATTPRAFMPRSQETHSIASKPQVAVRTVKSLAIVKTRHGSAQIELHRMTFVWYLMLACALAVPVFVILSARFYDAMPWSPNLGAFIIGGGAILIAAIFPFAGRYRAFSVTVMKEYAKSRQLSAESLKSLTYHMLISSACAELPAFAGLIYFFMTREIIGSLLLCTPAVMMILVLFRPGDLHSV